MMVPAMQLTQVALDVASVELDDFPAMHKHKRKTVYVNAPSLSARRGCMCGGWLMSGACGARPGARSGANGALETAWERQG